MAVDWKQRAIEQWSADPCGPPANNARELLAARRAYAPWMAEVLDYTGAAGLKVLDVGCGQGIDLCEYALAGANVTGIDLTPRHVSLARQHLAELGLDARVVQGDAEDLPFPDATFDRVSSNGVLHHTPDMPRALAEIRRVLQRDGRATLIVYNRDSAHYWIQQVFGHGIVRGELLRERTISNLLSANIEFSSIDARPLVRVYRRRALRRLLAEAGFSNVSVEASPMKPDETSVTALLPGPLKAFISRLRLPMGWFLIAQGERP